MMSSRLAIRAANNNGKPASVVDENQAALLRKSKTNPTGKTTKMVEKGETRESKGQRAPLETIVANVHGQPKRHGLQCQEKFSKVAKGKVPETSFAALPKQSFAVHQDNETEQETKENFPVKDETTTELLYVEESNCETTASVRQPLSTLSLNHDSPMFLDSSVSTVTASTEPAQSSSLCYLREDLLVPDYAKDIFNYLREFEARCRPKPHYMKKQPDITNGMRSILVDWLVEVVEEYKLNSETLYLAVGYIDRFLSCMSVLRGKLQLVGTASMFISSKYEEIYPPDVDEFVFITDNTYTKKQVLRMEQIILKVLAFDLATPTVYHFLQQYFHQGNFNEHTKNLALYLGELTLLEADPYLQFLPSIIAGSVLCLACHTLGLECWPEKLKHFTGYDIEDFKLCLHFLFKTYVNAPSYQQQAVREKYLSGRYLEVANLLPPITQPV